MERRERPSRRDTETGSNCDLQRLIRDARSEHVKRHGYIHVSKNGEREFFQIYLYWLFGKTPVISL
jgi:hypothetical protein